MAQPRQHPAPDPEALKAFSFLFFSKLEGAVTATMIHLGDRLGLYEALAERPMTSAELAHATGLDERWIREWLHNQAASRVVTVAAGEVGVDRFAMSPEAIAVMADPGHPAYGMGWFERLPETIGIVGKLEESFRTGVGLDYDAFGPAGAAGIERAFAPWYANFLVPLALPTLDGVIDRLQAGAVVADIGCGGGVAVMTMAAAFPNSQFHGYDISEHALERARAKRLEQGAANAHFHNAKLQPLPSDGSIDLVTTFDCIHDMTQPAEMMRAIRAALGEDGVWLLVDIKARDTFTENVAKNPMASMMYGISVLSCMSSALSEPGGAGLGTLGLSAHRAETMARDAGFTRFRTLEVPHAVNAFYEVRP